MNPLESAAFTFGYNHPLFAQRVHDVLTIVKYVQSNERKTKRLDLVGLGGAGPWTAAARVKAWEAIDHAAIGLDGFRFGQVSDIHDVSFLPGGAKYDDVPGLLAVGAPKPLWLAGEGGEAPGIVRAAYHSNGATCQLSVF